MGVFTPVGWTVFTRMLCGRLVGQAWHADDAVLRGDVRGEVGQALNPATNW